ncbi:hypothetical protein AVEN_185391-1 [Araneus ventricosus]|uniref:Uncharacterized protein n=1 Tax=Araneus ventricosus TaxID=182803 RepID=A0A4Y2CHS2_ARAVE|nr:hypothetical protein AVEN_185391-1 [Araneus ventricosus]
MSLQNLSVIGCDRTDVNTGWKGGVIRLLETYIGTPLQWNICMLHTNELPLRHFILEMDDCTKGTYSYSGPIGLLLKDCEKIQLSNLMKLTVLLAFGSERYQKAKY